MTDVWKKWLWRSAKALGVLGLLIVVLSAIGLFYVNTEAGKRDLVAWVNGYFNTSEGQIEFGPLEGSLYGKFTLPRVVFSDADGEWMEIKTAEVDWSPLGLLTGNVKLSSLDIQSVRFIRAPHSSADAEPDAPLRLVLPELPVDIHIKSFVAKELEIGANLVVGGARFRGNGALDYVRNGDLALQMDMAALGKNKDRLTVDIQYPQDSAELTVDADIQAPQGGLIAKIIGLDMQYDAAATFQGAGPIDDWNGALNVRVGDTDIAEGTLSRAGQALSIRARLDAGGFVPEAGAALFGRTAQLTLDVTPGDEQRRHAVVMELKAETLDLRASGSFSSDQVVAPGSIAFELQVKNAAPFNRMLAPANFQPFTLTGTLANINQKPRVKAGFDAVSITYGTQVAGQASGQFDATLYSDRVELLANGSLVNASGEALEPVLGVLKSGLNWSIDTAMNRQNSAITIKKASLKNQSIALDATGEIGGGGYPFKTRLEVALSDIGQLLEETTGQAFLTADILQAGDQQTLDASVQLTTQQFAVANDHLGILVGDGPSVVLRARHLPDGDFVFSDVQATGNFVTLDGGASISADQAITNADFHVNVKQLEKAGQIAGLDLSGNLDIDGKFSGSLAAPSVELKTRLNQLDLQGLTLQNIDLMAVFNDFVAQPSGHVAIRGESSIGDLVADADLVTEPDSSISVSDIGVSLGVYDASGSLQIAKSQPVTGAIAITTREAGTNSFLHYGYMDAEIRLGNESGLQRFDVSGKLTDGAFPLRDGDVLRIKSGTLSADALLEESSRRLNTTMQLSGLYHPGLQAESAEITLAHVQNEVTYDVHVIGTNIAPFDIRVSGQGSIQPDMQKISLALEGIVGQIPLQSDAPLVFNRSGEGISLAPFSLSIGNGEIAGAFTAKNQAIVASLHLTKADIRSIHGIFPQIPLSGVLEASFDLDAKPDDTRGHFDFDLSQIQVDDGTTLLDQNLGLSAKGELADENLTFSGDILLADIVDAGFNGRLPLTINSATLDVGIPEDVPVAGQLAWHGEIGIIWPVFELVSHDLSGEFDVDLKLAGTMDSPVLDGTLRVANGRYEHVQSGFAAAEITLASTIKDRRLQIDSLTATDGGQGALTAEGFAEITQDFGIDAEARLNLAKARLIRRPQLGLTASSNLILRKKGMESDITGDITVDTASVGKITQDGAAVIELDVREVNGENHSVSGQTTVQNDVRRNPALLDVNLHVPGKLFIRSYGLDSEWSSELVISGTTAHPTVAGAASLVRGTFDFSGKRFKLTQGGLTFFEGRSDDPLLNMRAEHQLPDLTAILTIGGRASAPTFEMSSIPALPQDEIISRIFFGTSVAALSPIEAVQLAATIHSLTTGGGQGFISGVRRKLGIDRLAIDQAQERDFGTTITGGKYLTNNIYVEVTTATATGETATAVEVGLTKNLSLITRRTLDHDNNLAIRWSWNY